MIDWLSSMSQTFEYYEVDPGTWKDKRRLTKMLSSSVKRDITTETLESASFLTTELFNECYIRVYLIAIQNGVRYKECLGTFLVQTPSYSFDGKVSSYSLDAYSPLLELKDVKPDMGFTIMKDAAIMDQVYSRTKEHLRAPVIKPTSSVTMPSNYTAESDDTWLSYLIAAQNAANYYYLLDDYGRVLFAPVQDIDSVKPVWTYDDGNSSILYAPISDDYDLYGIPNVVEVVYTKSNGTILQSRVENNNSSSPTSIKSRGREVLHREVNPTIAGEVEQGYIDLYAKNTLKNFNILQHTLSYSHGYCGTRIGDVVRLNYERAGIKNVKAKIISQSIDCKEGCVVNETAMYATNMWKE